MDTEFVTVYIEKMKSMLNDLQTRVLFLETDIHFKEKVIGDLTTKNNELQTALDKVAKKQVKKQEETF
jgi:uncharacterized coiled-coil protein SlyX